MSILAKTPLLLRVVSLYIVVLTPIFLLSASYSQNQAQALQEVVSAPKEPTTQVVKEITGKPVRLRIPRLDVNLQVVKGVYNSADDTWAVSDDKAQFITSTAKPNNIRGSTFIYGHNRPFAFEPLAKLKKGDIVKVTTSNHHVFTYTYTRDIVIKPSKSDILYINPRTPTLTLMTCDGAWSESRRVMFFTLKEAR